MPAAPALDRHHRLRRLGVALLVVCLAAAGLTACNDPAGAPSASAFPSAAAGASAAPSGDAAATPVPADPAGFDPGLDERPTPVPGPDLGVAEVAAVDPELLVPSPYGLVPSDRLWFMLPAGSTAADAQRVADQMQGTVGGRIEVADLWLILIPAQSPDGLLFALEFAGQIPGIDAVFPDIEIQPAADCAVELADPVYAGTNAGPYALVGVPNAWQAWFASGIRKNPVHVGIVDTALTRDPSGTIGWEFDNVTWVGDPAATPGYNVDRTTNKPTRDGFHHADGVLGIIAGDRTDGGIAGIASPLGGNLLVSHADFQHPSVTTSDDPDAEFDWGGRLGHTSTLLLDVKRQVESGATIINLSVGTATVGPENSGQAAMWTRFYARMAKEHPEVLFVAAAGNNSIAIDGHSSGPGGIAAPNLITVGSVQTDETVTSYSNIEAPGGEVTLFAPGDQAVWGTGIDGKVRHANGGTSSATPMVTATAALIRSVNPTLTAAEVKKLITDATRDGPGFNKVLQVDLAVRKAIDAVRAAEGKLPLTDEEIAGAACELEVWGEPTGESNAPPAIRWQVGARLPLITDATAVTLTIGGGGRPADWRKTITASGQEVGWSLLVPTAGADITVTRLDNGYWRQFHLRGTLATPTPAPTPTPTPTPRPTPKPADPGYDCSNPPTPGTIAYLKWSLHCKAIAP